MPSTPVESVGGPIIAFGLRCCMVRSENLAGVPSEAAIPYTRRDHQIFRRRCLPGTKPNVKHVTRAVVYSQMLFVAGHSLTTGGFLSYFFEEFGPSAFALALLQILPDASEASGLTARWINRRAGGHKKTWAITFLLARLSALLIPFSLFWEFTSLHTQPQIYILSCVVLWHVFQGIAFVTYLSWLSELVPEVGWGRFFARRNIAELMIRLVVPIGIALLRRKVLDASPHDLEVISYAVIFTLGSGLCLTSMLPLLRLPDSVPPSRNDSAVATSLLSSLMSSRAFLLLLAHGWWLSLFQGLTQAVLFKFRVRVLGISLETFLLLNALMYALQIPLSLWAGRLCDRGRDWDAYLWSLLVVSAAMLVYLSATASTWWLLFLAHALFGVFGMVNVCNFTIALKLAPEKDNLMHLALFRQIGGLLAGIAGLVGGLWLDDLIQNASNPADGLDWGCRLLMLISWLGRVTAVLWLLPLAWGFWRGTAQPPSRTWLPSTPPHKDANS